MINLAPWYYRNLYNNKEIVSNISTYNYKNLFNEEFIEVLVKLNKNIVPSWAHESRFYSNADGSGTSPFLNIAINKGLSEALERWAFYETINSQPLNYSFTENPSTTGMAAYPSVTTYPARKKAILEACERWAVHEFWRGNLPIKQHLTSIKDLNHYEIVTNFSKIKISLLSYEKNHQFFYSFAAEDNLKKSFTHAMIELSRNIRVLNNFKNIDDGILVLSDISDKRLHYFSKSEGYQLFLDKIHKSPNNINSYPIVSCDQEIKGPWSQYAKVWRFLYKNSFPENEIDKNIFMF